MTTTRRMVIATVLTMLFTARAALVVVLGLVVSPQQEAPMAEATPPSLTEVQKLTLKDKLRDATEAARLAAPEVMAKEIADFMTARQRNAQDKSAAVSAYYQSLPKVDGYLLTQDGEYVKQKETIK